MCELGHEVVGQEATCMRCEAQTFKYNARKSWSGWRLLNLGGMNNIQQSKRCSPNSYCQSGTPQNASNIFFRGQSVLREQILPCESVPLIKDLYTHRDCKKREAGLEEEACY